MLRLVPHPDVEHGMIGLPDLVRRCRFPVMEEIERFLVLLRVMVGEGNECGIERPHNIVAWDRPALLFSHRRHVALDMGDGGCCRRNYVK